MYIIRTFSYAWARREALRHNNASMQIRGKAIAGSGNHFYQTISSDFKLVGIVQPHPKRLMFCPTSFGGPDSSARDKCISKYGLSFSGQKSDLLPAPCQT